MEIRLFGSLVLAVKGRPVPIAGQAERSLLALLACSAGRVVSVDRLVDELWGEDPPANPANALQVGVSKLRRQVGELIRTRAGGYLLDVDPEDVDVDRFARLIRLAGSRRPSPSIAVPSGRFHGAGVGAGRSHAFGGAVPGSGGGARRGTPAGGW